MFLKDNEAIKNAQKKFDQLTGLKFDWDKFESDAIRGEITIGAGTGWREAYEKALPTLFDMVVESTLENDGARRYSMLETMLLFNDLVMTECYKHWLKDDAVALYKAEHPEMDKKSLSDDPDLGDSNKIDENSLFGDQKFNDSPDIRGAHHGLVDYTGKGKTYSSDMVAFLREYSGRLNAAPASKTQQNEQRYKKGQLSINDMLQLAGEKNPAEGQTLGVDDAKTLASYAKALENVNKSRGWLWIFSMRAHFREKNAIKQIRAVVAKCETPRAELEKMTGVNQDLAFDKEVFQGMLDKSVTMYEEQERIDVLVSKEEEATNRRNKDPKNPEKIAAYEQCRDQTKQAKDAFKEKYNVEYGFAMVHSYMDLKVNMELDPIEQNDPINDNIIGEVELNNNSLHDQLLQDTSDVLNASSSHIEAPTQNVNQKEMDIIK